MNKETRNEIQFHLDRLKALASHVETHPLYALSPDEADWIEATWEYVSWCEEWVLYEG